ncbi:MAG: ABC transporter ATP-binding protein [Anaerolineae bacterium]|nr:ABC transporter ATP-binding protein [Anaerolineae bacterium]
MKVKLENLSKRWGKVIGADHVDLDIGDGEFVAFLGPSGCGKTTTLLMLAGIYKPTEGYIRFDGRIVNQMAPKDRNIGMVFQSYALYPHMNVFQNISYPLKLQKIPKGEMQERTQRVADMMSIGHLMDRKPAQLSGGQQQRVAIARALANDPPIIVADEPTGRLDSVTAESIFQIFLSLSEQGKTILMVTHDRSLARRASRTLEIADGEITTSNLSYNERLN